MSASNVFQDNIKKMIEARREVRRALKESGPSSDATKRAIDELKTVSKEALVILLVAFEILRDPKYFSFERLRKLFTLQFRSIREYDRANELIRKYGES